jgi:hypothetical protein
LTAGLGFGILGGLLLMLVGRLVLIGSRQLDLQIVTESAIGLAWLLFCVAVWLWVVVGIWRASARERKQAKWLARAISVFGTILLLPLAVGSSKAAQELAYLVQGQDPMGAPVRISQTRDRLVLTGYLAQGSSIAFKEKLRRSGVTTVVLNSPGGRIGEAIQISKDVRSRGLSTIVDGSCESACTIILAAGSDRAMFPGARVGFHQSTFPGNEQNDDDLETEGQRDYFRKLGVPEDFVAKAFSTRSDSMWYPAESEMIAAGILNKPGLSLLLDQIRVGLSSNLPTRIDAATVLRRISTTSYTMTLHYNTSLSQEIDKSAFTLSMKPHLKQQVCRSKSYKRVISNGGEIHFEYSNNEAEIIDSIAIKECPSD